MTLGRLRRMPPQELSWRGVAAARTAVQRISARVWRPRWRREGIARTLAPDVVDDALRVAIHEQRWAAVQEQLVSRIRSRPARFPLDPASAPELRAEILARWPAAASHAADRADRILRGRHDLLGYRGLEWASDGAVDWHFDPVYTRRAPRRFWADVPYLDPEVGDHKIIWELNRHQHWLALGRAAWLTGDSRCVRRIVDELRSWLAANPPLVGINWASMLEIGLRAISWTWGLHFLLADATEAPAGQAIDSSLASPGSEAADPGSRNAGEPWLPDLLVGLDRQLTHVEQNLSYYFSPNTHLTGEALALYTVGLALPELAASRRWVETGRRILLTEIDRQILADGGHAERSTHYQRYTLDFYLFALIAARRTDDVAAIPLLTDAVTRLAVFTRTMADEQGRLPLIGDDDGGMLWPIAGRECSDVRDSLALAAVALNRPDLAPWGVPEEVFWLAGRTAIDRTPIVEAAAAGAGALPSRACPETGYVVLRDGHGGHAVVDVGQHGYMNGGHAHADALAITLTLDHRALLVDPGTSTYTMDRLLRDRLRSSASHNTVTIDDRSAALPSGPFHWKTRADARLHAWRGNPAFDWVEAAHDGYAPVGLRRTVLRTADAGWLIVDEVLGDGRHAAAAHWLFEPGWMVSCDAPGRLRAHHLDGGAAWLLHDASDVALVLGDETSGLGWHAPAYGTLVPAWTASTSRHERAPFSLMAWIGPARARDAAPPALERLAPSCDPGGCATAALVRAGHRTSVFLVRPGEPSARDARGCEILAYQTNARVLHYTEEAGALVALDLVDASHALSLREGWLSIAAQEPVADLHVSLADGVLDLRASTLPGSLRIEGGAVHGVRVLHLNGREHAARPEGRRDTLIIASSDWAGARSPGASSLIQT